MKHFLFGEFVAIIGRSLYDLRIARVKNNTRKKKELHIGKSKTMANKNEFNFKIIFN